MADRNLKKVPLYQVDAFTSKAFGGNPAAVCLLKTSIDDATKQQIGAEMNLSETAFVEPKNNNSSSPFLEDAYFCLRWFTPAKEADLCGHATLASAAVLFQEVGNHQETLYFETRSGQLSVRRDQSAQGLLLEMDLPAYPTNETLAPPLEKVKSELQTVFTGVSIQDVAISDLSYMLVALAPGTTQQELEDMEVDVRRLESLADKKDLFAVVVTCSGDGKPYHILSRFFAPWAGVDEDPVTGSAHAVLGPYWAARLKDPPQTLQARQCSPRVGELKVTVCGDKSRVTVAGNAVVISKGELYLPSSAST